MKRDSAWLLRRYRDGAVPDWQVRHVLQREFDCLIEGHSAIRPELDELRRSVPDRLRGFDTASDKALQAMGERRFDRALNAIRTASSELDELRRFVVVATDLRRASEALASIDDLLPSALTAQPTLRVLRRLRDVARSLLDHGEARKARFVVLLLHNQLGTLRTRVHKELTASLEGMLLDLGGQVGDAVAHIRKLAQDGYHHLAERLAEDLEVDLALRDRSSRDLGTPGGSLGPILADLEVIRQRADSLQMSLARWLDSVS